MLLTSLGAEKRADKRKKSRETNRRTQVNYDSNEEIFDESSMHGQSYEKENVQDDLFLIDRGNLDKGT